MPTFETFTYIIICVPIIYYTYIYYYYYYGFIPSYVFKLQKKRRNISNNLLVLLYLLYFLINYNIKTLGKIKFITILLIFNFNNVIFK